MSIPSLFDPLRALRERFYAIPAIGRDGGLFLRFDGPVLPRQRQEAMEMLREHDALLRLQVANGGVSVQKLVAHGKARMQGGRCVPA